MNNMTAIKFILENVKSMLVQSRLDFLDLLKHRQIGKMGLTINNAYKNSKLVGYARELCIQVIQFQTINTFIFGAIVSDPDQITYKPPDSPEMKEFNDFIQVVKTDNLDELKTGLEAMLNTMFKTGAQKTADMLIPANQRFNRLC